jgi:hypothetical protein
MRDRQIEIAQRFDAFGAAAALDVVNEELIAEHAARPRGPHGHNLQKLLRYMRRAPLPHTYVVVAVEPWRDYRIGTLKPLEKNPAKLAPRVGDVRSFGTEEEAMHAVFLQRLDDMREVVARRRGNAE